MKCQIHFAVHDRIQLTPRSLILVFFLFQSTESDTDVKITDFGYAKTVHFPNSLRTQCGTEEFFVAPKILEHRPEYDVPCGMWSLGVIIYCVGRIQTIPWRWRHSHAIDSIWRILIPREIPEPRIGRCQKSDCFRMLTVDPQKRITAAAALRSPWIQTDETALGTELSDNMKEGKL
jgi:serine/threonine protein kinase